jgi:hypothetical protein
MVAAYSKLVVDEVFFAIWLIPFDKVPHQRLLEKLSYYEVRGYLHS